jgi:hypothetical protein
MDGTPSQDTVHRAETISDYYEAYGQHIGRIVCSGGFPARLIEPPPGREATCMQDILVRNGVPARKIEVEDQSVCTFTNFENIAHGGYFDAMTFTPGQPLGLGVGRPHFARARLIAQQVFAASKASIHNIAPPAEDSALELIREKCVGAPIVRWALRGADPGNLTHTARAREQFYTVGARPARLYLRAKERLLL